MVERKHQLSQKEFLSNRVTVRLRDFSRVQTFTISDFHGDHHLWGLGEGQEVWSDWEAEIRVRERRDDASMPLSPEKEGAL